jgi:hypothetical protein
VVVFARGLVVLGTRFGGDGLAHAMHKARVPSGGHADDLWEVRGVARKSDAVQTFVPPIVFRYAEARNSGGVIAHLRDFFFQSHATNEVVNSLIDWESWIHELERLGAGWLLSMRMLWQHNGEDEEA